VKDYCNLHVHTTYSLMDSLIKPSELFKKVKELGQSAVAVTDHASLAGAWDSLKYSKEAGVKLIMGCEFNFVDDLSSDDKTYRHVILLAKNHQGYKNLLKANKIANDNGIIKFKKVTPLIDWSVLEQCSDGVICTTACGNGILGSLINNRDIEGARSQAKRLKKIFGENLAFEIEPNSLRRLSNIYHGYEDQTLVNRQLIKFGQELDVRIIAATNAHYPTKDKQKAHDVMLAIGAGQPVVSQARLKYSGDFYLQSREEVIEFFSRNYKDLAETFCDNTMFFANMCEDPEWIDPKFSNPSGKELPEFPVKDQEDYLEFKTWWKERESDKIISKLNIDQAYLRYWTMKGFTNKVTDPDKQVEYLKRSNYELQVIEDLGFSSYYLIVADFINFARKNNIPVGPSRGSGGASIVGYFTDIHQTDPIKYGLIFERFLNRAKKAYPDYDVDFASFGKERVQEYLVKKYGEDKVAHVSNVLTLTPKPYAKGIARAFLYGGDRKAAVQVGISISDSIGEKPGERNTVLQAMEKFPLFAEYAKQYPELRSFAEDVGNKATAWATHAGGIVIGKRPLAEIVPIRKDKDGNVALEYEKERAEANGLVKIDILAVSTLDVIYNTLKLIKQNGKRDPSKDIEKYDIEDPKVYDLISKGDTYCVFQLGTSAGTVELCRRIKPKNIEDLALINALARPSAKDIRKPFIEARDSGNKVELIHSYLERAFSSTLGFAVYEECLMYLAKDVAGWNMEEADRLRKFTKEKGKYPERDKQLREDFINDTINNGIETKLANRIWDEIVGSFGGYAFNKSHAIGYSFLAYQTAYLKAYYPLEFLTANLMQEVTSKAQKAKENIIKLKREIRALGVNIIPPNINTSDIAYKIIDENTLRTGLDALKNMGDNDIPEIIKHRPYKTLNEFLAKVSGTIVRASAIQAMIASGCMDEFNIPRKQMFLHIQDYKAKLRNALGKNRDVSDFKYPWSEDMSDWTMVEKYAMEVLSLGEGLSCKDYQAYPGFFSRNSCRTSELAEKYPEPAETNGFSMIHINDRYDGPIEGIIRNIFEFKVKKETSASFGQPMAKILLQDPYGGEIGLTVFPKKYNEINNRIRVLSGGKVKLEPGTAICVAGGINWYEGDISIVYDDLKRCAPSPPLPNDLQGRKVSMRIKKVPPRIVKDREELMGIIEGELIEDGSEAYI